MSSALLRPVAPISLSPRLSPLWQSRLLFLLALTVLMVLMTSNAHAGTDETFKSWVDDVSAWITGSLGKGVAISFVVVGIIGSITRGTLMPIAVGVGCALGLNYAPAIVTGVFTAVA